MLGICLAFQNLKHGEKYKEAIQTDNFRVSLVDDVKWAELCGALKVREWLTVLDMIALFPNKKFSIYYF